MFFAWALASGTAAPEGSVTVPKIVAVEVWAASRGAAPKGHQRDHQSKKRTDSDKFYAFHSSRILS